MAVELRVVAAFVVVIIAAAVIVLRGGAAAAGSGVAATVLVARLGLGIVVVAAVEDDEVLGASPTSRGASMEPFLLCHLAAQALLLLPLMLARRPGQRVLDLRLWCVIDAHP